MQSSRSLNLLFSLENKANAKFRTIGRNAAEKNIYEEIAYHDKPSWSVISNMNLLALIIDISVVENQHMFHR